MSVKQFAFLAIESSIDEHIQQYFQELDYVLSTVTRHDLVHAKDVLMELIDFTVSSPNKALLFHISEFLARCQHVQQVIFERWLDLHVIRL